MKEFAEIALIDQNAPVVIVSDPIQVEGEIIYGERIKTGNQGTGYYRILRDYNVERDADDYREKGFVKDGYAANEALHVYIGELEYKLKYDNTENMDWFDETFQFDPNGSEKRQAQIGQLMREINTLDVNLSQTKVALGEFNPHVGDSGQLEGSTSLVPAATGMAQTKLAVATTRNNVLKFQKSMVAKTNKLKALMTEQSRALALKVKEIEELAKRANEAIWTINLYLGKEEEIVKLVTGEPAPAEQRITIRQVALFMDEECGVYAENDGIDVGNVGKFDDWLIAHPKNLQQILPEDKGIVALHIRRKAKDYKDPWLNKDMNDANLRWTYLLIRNGENVYRVYIDLDTGRHLFPTRGEFEDYFWERNRDTGEKEPLKPGSKEWNKAMDASESRQKHYMRVLLVLQGLVDRTPIFKPMPTDRINLSDPRHCEEWLNLIYEAENVITDGKPNFDEWQWEVNEQLDVGCRIIGVFGYSIRGSKDRDGYGDESRIYPTNADNPDSDCLYTIEDREGDRYIFRYQRKGEKVYSRDWRGGSHEPKVRARCWVAKDDGFVLNFDAATLDRLEYYQTHKLSREFYAKMLPILQIAVRLKREEQATEAPFRLMLIGQIMQRFGVGNEEAEAKVDELIKWWKFKNRTHRALVGENDSQAVKMILDEFGLRRKQEEVRRGVQVIRDSIVRVIAGQTPEPVLIAHKKDNQYVAYVPHNDENIWVAEQTWTHNRQTGDVKLKESKAWKLVDKRHERWEILYKGDRWTDWKINPSLSLALTDPEIEALVQAAVEKKGYFEGLTKSRKEERGDKNAGYLRFLPLAALVNDEFEVSLWYTSREAIIPTETIINTRSEGPTVEKVKVKWKRTGKGVELEPYFSDSGSYGTYMGDVEWTERGQRVIKLWQENIDLVRVEQDEHRDHKKKVDALQKRFKDVPKLAGRVQYDRAIAKAKLDFFADHGDPELWEDHLKELAIGMTYPPGLGDALDLLVERHINPEGWTLQQVYDEAVKHGLLADEGADYWNRHRKLTKVPTNVPMDFVVPAPVTLPGESDEDDD